MKTSLKLISAVIVMTGLGLSSIAMAAPAVGTFNFTYDTKGLGEQYSYSGFALDDKWATNPGVFALGTGLQGQTATLKPGVGTFKYTFNFAKESITAACEGQITYNQDGTAKLMISHVSGSKFGCQQGAAGSPTLTQQSEGVYSVNFPSGL
jgi:hypothetical protein